MINNNMMYYSISFIGEKSIRVEFNNNENEIIILLVCYFYIKVNIVSLLCYIKG